MKAGDIIFFKGKGIISKLIRLVTHGEYNHVAIAISQNLVLESEYNSGVRIRNIEAYKKEKAKIKVIQMNASKKQIEQLHKICDSYTSFHFYDWKQILKLFVKYIFHITLPWKNTSDKVICSELVAMVMLDIGMSNNYDMVEFSPQELYDYLAGEINGKS